MTSQGHVTTASLKQANKEDNREAFFISLHLKTVNCKTMYSIMLEFGNDQTSSHRVMN